jgi:hypothetical protein
VYKGVAMGGKQVGITEEDITRMEECLRGIKDERRQSGTVQRDREGYMHLRNELRIISGGGELFQLRQFQHVRSWNCNLEKRGFVRL